MSTFVREYVDGYAVCQSTKSRPKTQVPLKPNKIPTDMWEIITMDFITDLPMSKGYNSLLVVVSVAAATQVQASRSRAGFSQTCQLAESNQAIFSGPPSHANQADRLSVPRTQLRLGAD